MQPSSRREPAPLALTDWQAANQFLADGDYAELATVLRQAQHALADGDPLLTAVLAAAYQICLVGHQFHEDVGVYRQEYAEAINREQVLQQRLRDIFLILGDADQSGSLPSGATQESDRDGAAEAQSPWRRLQLRLHHWLGGALEPERPAPDIADSDWDPLPRPDPKMIEGSARPIAPPDKDSAASAAPEDAPYAGPAVNVYCLGAFRAFVGDRLIENWSGNKSKAIFKFLILHGGVVQVETLLDHFWANEPPQTARHNLYQAIYLLRQTLQLSPDDDFAYIVSESGNYQLNPRLQLWVDFDAFRKRYQAGLRLADAGQSLAALRELEIAESIYEGELLAEDVYEEWTLLPREDLAHAYLDCLDRLSRLHWEEGNYGVCASYCQEILKLDSCREDAHRRLMLAYMQRGQRPLALRQYQRCVDALRAELDVPPMPATEELYRRIRAGEVHASTSSEMRSN